MHRKSSPVSPSSGFCPSDFFARPRGEWLVQGIAATSTFVRGVFAWINASHVGLDEQRVAMRSLPNIGEAGLDLDTCHETKVGMRVDGGGERAATGKDLQCPPWCNSAALSLNGECAHRRHDINDPRGCRNFHFSPFRERREQGPIHDIDNWAHAASGSALRDVMGAIYCCAEAHTTRARFNNEGGAGRKAQRFEATRLQPKPWATPIFADLMK